MTIRHLVVLGHPAAASFNHAIATAYCTAVSSCGQRAVLRDLYAAGFDPLLRASERPRSSRFEPSPDVAYELDQVRNSAVITLVYPIWFGMPPAVITGYVDRVLGAGLHLRAIRDGDPHALLAGKRLVLLTTSGTTSAWLGERGQWLALRQAFDNYLADIFSFGGCVHEHFDAIVAPLAPDYAAECLGRVRTCARSICSDVLSEAHRTQLRAKLAGGLRH